MADEEFIDGDNIDDLPVPILKSKIEELQQDKERRKEKIDRLHQNLKDKTAELAKGREEADRWQRQLDDQLRERQDRDADSRADKSFMQQDDPLAKLVRGDPDAVEEVKDKVRASMEQQLEDALKRNPRSEKNELGIRQHDEMELMVRKPAKEQAQEEKNIDTVMIVFAKNSESQSYLSVRVDCARQAKELLNDACQYWGLSEVEYVLITQHGSKVHDDMQIQNCFRRNEQALLTLIQKDPKKTKLRIEEHEAIKKKKVGKTKQGRAATAAAPDAEHQREDDGKREEEDKGLEELEQQMITKQVYGLWEFLTQLTDKEVTDHIKPLPKTREYPLMFRNLLVYPAVTILCLVSLFWAEPPKEAFFLREGVLRSLMQEWVVTNSAGQENDVVTPEFQDIRTHDEAWSWLRNTVPYNLLDAYSDMRDHNYLPGWLQVRMQMVKSPSRENCRHKDFIPENMECDIATYNLESAERDTFTELDAYWSSANGSADPNNLLRAGNPAKFEEFAGTHTTYEGRYQRYDPSGYWAEYNMQYKPLQDAQTAMRNDLDAMYQYWINDRTRALHVSFVAYSGNYDLWIATHFLISFAPNGLVSPMVSAETYKPIAAEWVSGWEFLILDAFILLIVSLYMCISQPLHHWRVQRERNEEIGRWKAIVDRKEFHDVPVQAFKHDPPWFKKHQPREPKTWKEIIFCWSNFFDMIGIAFLQHAIFWMRYAHHLPGILYSDTVEYKDLLKGGLITRTWEHAEVYRATIVLQTLVIACLMWRWVSYFTLNRFFFVVYQTIKQSAAVYARFAMVMLPVMASFGLLAHEIWSVYDEGYRTFWSSQASYLVRLVGDKDSARLADTKRPVTVLFSAISFFVVRLILINSWFGGLVQTFQRVRITCGYRPEDKHSPYHWKEDDYIKYCLYPAAGRFYKEKICRRVVKLFKREKGGGDAPDGA